MLPLIIKIEARHWVSLGVSLVLVAQCAYSTTQYTNLSVSSQRHLGYQRIPSWFSTFQQLYYGGLLQADWAAPPHRLPDLHPAPAGPLLRLRWQQQRLQHWGGSRRGGDLSSRGRGPNRNTLFSSYIIPRFRSAASPGRAERDSSITSIFKDRGIGH